MLKKLGLISLMPFQPHKTNSHCEVVEEDEPGPMGLPHVTEHGALVSSVSIGFLPTLDIHTSLAFVRGHICNIELWLS